MKKNDNIILDITEINNLGCGVGKSDGMVVFVKGAVSGERIKAKIIKVNKTYAVARLEEIIVPSDKRTKKEFCTAPLSCGGCVYRHITYEHELELKQNYVYNAFRKVGLPDVEVEPVRTTGVTSGYRNKAQYPLKQGKNGVEAGFFATKTHNIVVGEVCSLQPPIFAEIVREVCQFATEKKISVYDEESGKGILRHIYLRHAKVTGEIMLCLVISADNLSYADEFVERITKSFSDIKSISINVNKNNTNVVLGREYKLLFGREYIEDVLCGVRFKISAGAFYQVNHDAAELLYSIAKEKADLCGSETLLDLYCGIGTIGLSMADKVKRLVGIEVVEEAVERARENAALNNVENAHFFCGDASDARKLLENAERTLGSLDVDVAIIDPPRKGSTRELIEYLSERNINRVVYVSCDPDTLARDCVIFRELGYNIGKVTPVDLFSRTGHVESVVCLTRRLDNELRERMN